MAIMKKNKTISRLGHKALDGAREKYQIDWF